jgi:hypothetical protein
MSTSVALPVPLHIDALAGQAAPPMPDESLGRLGDLPAATQRAQDSKSLGTSSRVDDVNDLTQTGWCVIFASDADPAIQAQLQPLIELRRNQVGDENLFKIFAGDEGVQPGHAADDFAARVKPSGVSLTAAVDPYAGLPYYVLLVGQPDRVPFEFQNLLKMQWAVGRLAFDDIEDYGRYAQAVVQYESAGYTPVQRRNAAVWMTRNDGDAATAMLSGSVGTNFLDTKWPLGSAPARFTLDAFTCTSQKQATKQQLIDILRGDVPGGAPAVIFTGSHGASYPITDAAQQRRMQGSLVTQEWAPGQPAGENNSFSAEDLPSDAKLEGTMALLYACFSGGCPTYNNYYFNADGSKKPLAPAPMIGALPQALLRRGMLAVIGHVDMAFPYSFQDYMGTPQVQAVRDPLTYMMTGRRVGWAADCLSDRWSRLGLQLTELQNPSATDAAPPAAVNPALQKALTLARDDARNYIVLGDPAAQLRVKDLK